ncbi:hypothetical protein KUV62_15500 [Salipiger bermudensis]|uniref:hypothetical protein n=1 Tax=Salipiger bermudensis TaxID=344736 RepID=UPI001C98FA91|nr:hypothetical protein [Salipiger bermudensis]MBY6005330.1 hypothetical protein [Salipiger bermudensis]
MAGKPLPEVWSGRQAPILIGLSVVFVLVMTPTGARKRLGTRRRAHRPAPLRGIIEAESDHGGTASSED